MSWEACWKWSLFPFCHWDTHLVLTTYRQLFYPCLKRTQPSYAPKELWTGLNLESYTLTILSPNIFAGDNLGQRVQNCNQQNLIRHLDIAFLSLPKVCLWKWGFPVQFHANQTHFHLDEKFCTMAIFETEIQVHTKMVECLPPLHRCNSCSYLLKAPRSLETFSFSFS